MPGEMECAVKKKNKTRRWVCLNCVKAGYRL